MNYKKKYLKYKIKYLLAKKLYGGMSTMSMNIQSRDRKMRKTKRRNRRKTAESLTQDKKL